MILQTESNELGPLGTQANYLFGTIMYFKGVLHGSPLHNEGGKGCDTVI